MEFAIFLGLALACLVLVLPIVALFRAGAAREDVQRLAARIAALERELRQLRAAPPPSAAPATRETAPQAPPTPREVSPPSLVPAPEPAPTPRHISTPPLPAERPARKPLLEPYPGDSPAAVRAPVPPQPPLDWEQFMGAKLFAWVGGLALFLGVAFFIKYSFERDLIPPAIRAAIGFAAGAGLLGGGVAMKRKAYAVTAQTLCATGVLILYATTFACRAFYHFPFFTLAPTLLLMSLITAVAFVLAVRLHAPVVALLGMLGGFLTPVLLSTGDDQPFGLFGYLALIDAGLIAVALRRRWHYLVPLGALGTALHFAKWTGASAAQRYFTTDYVLTPMAVLIGFAALFLAGVFLAKRSGQLSRAISGSALALAFVGFGFAGFLLGFPSIAERPLLLFGFVFLLDLAVLALVLIEEKLTAAQPAAGLIVFALLAAWTTGYVSRDLLHAALALYLVFTLFHAVAPFAIQRLRGAAPLPWWMQMFPALALVLTVGPLLQTTAFAFLIWPFVLLVDLLAVVLAVLSASLLPILVVLVLTLAVTATAVAQIPATLTGLPTTLAMLGLFSALFLAASLWAARRLAAAAAQHSTLYAQLLPACSVVLPFVLLIMVTERLPIADPTPVFGLALLLVVLLFGVTRLLPAHALPLAGLLSALALEHAWHFRHFDPAHPTIPLVWYVGFYAVSTIFPFLFRRAFADSTLPWTAAALTGPLHFYLILRVFQTAWPQTTMGLVPAAFVLPSALALFVLLRQPRGSDRARMSQHAWFGGVTLFFITLIIPIQWDREWITLGWALEGAALCWLFHRIPHPGLRLTGVVLLTVAFVRLAVNPAVLSYHARAATPIFNWYFYAYAVVVLCLFAGARLLAPPRHRALGTNVPPLLYGFGTVLAFLLVNIEIADFFTAPGASALTFKFSGNLARDMSYSIAWALFALLLVIIGIAKRAAAVRYAGLGLLGVTLLKLFLHDLSQLGQLYRIGALVAVAIIAIVASFLYQRFLAAVGKPADAGPPPSAP